MFQKTLELAALIMVLNCPAELRLCPPHLGVVASRIRSSLDRMMQDIVPGAWLVSKYTSKASALFLRPFDYRGKRGTQPGKLSTLHGTGSYLQPCCEKSHLLACCESCVHAFSRTCWLLWADDGAGAALFRCCSWLVFSGADASLWLEQH